MNGLCIPESNIFVYGQNGSVKKDELLMSFKHIENLTLDKHKSRTTSNFIYCNLNIIMYLLKVSQNAVLYTVSLWEI